MPYMTPTTNFAGQVQPNSWAGKAGNALTNNSNMLLALGLGLLDKRQNNQVSYSQIGTQALAGSQYDQERREREEKREAKNMMAEWLINEKGLSPQNAKAAMSNPAVMADFLKGKKAPISVGQNETLLDPDTFEPVYSSPEEPETSPDIRTYQFYANEELKANRQPLPMLEWKQATKGQGMSLTTNPDGTVSFSQGGGKPLSESQSKDTVFYTRAAGALPIIDKMGDALTDLSESVGGQAPIVGNYLKSDEYQQAEQAGREFLTSLLRKDSGATITPEETKLYGGTYLPQPGDGAPLLKQKKEARARALLAIELGLPPAAILRLENAGVQTGGAAPPDSPNVGAPNVQDMTDQELLDALGGF